MLKFVFIKDNLIAEFRRRCKGGFLLFLFDLCSGYLISRLLNGESNSTLNCQHQQGHGSRGWVLETSAGKLPYHVKDKKEKSSSTSVLGLVLVETVRQRLEMFLL